MSKKTMVVSFSGGRTSAYMSKWLIDNKSDEYDFVFIFANTGLEDERTLEFVDKCDQEFNLNLVWIEAVVNPVHMKGVTHKIVNFDTASRNGEPFEAHIAKSGIPNANKPQCSDRLKALPIEHYKRTNGLTGKLHAIGMRIDEPNRVLSKRKRDLLKGYGLSYWWVEEFSYKQDSEKLTELSLAGIPEDLHHIFVGRYNLIYPLHSKHFHQADKSDVNMFWESQDFNLELEEHQGNCSTCWKKSNPKLWLIALEDPSKFEFMDRMEKTYQHVKKNNNGEDRVFFRQHRSAQDIISESSMMDIRQLRSRIGYRTDDDSGCSESCEPYTEDLFSGM